MGECQQKEEKSLRACLCGPEGYEFGGAVERGDQPGGRKIDQQTDQLRRRNGTEDAEYGATSGAVVLLCPKVLADEGSESHGKAGNRQEDESLDLGVGTASCDCHLAKLIDIGLDEYICNRNNGILESGRKSIGQDLS